MVLVRGITDNPERWGARRQSVRLYKAELGYGDSMCSRNVTGEAGTAAPDPPFGAPVSVRRDDTDATPRR
jgi:hypothetical protein